MTHPFHSSKADKVYLLISLVLFCACQSPKQEQATQSPFEQVHALYRADLEDCLAALDSIAAGADAPRHLALARQAFKKAEPVMAFAENADFNSLNRPNILSITEEDRTDVKVQEAMGMQVLEELIHGEEAIDSTQLRQNLSFIRSRLQFLLRNSNFEHYKDYHFLWLLQQEVLRIATTGITGFDSPVLAASLTESAFAYGRLLDFIRIYQARFASARLYADWEQSLTQSISTLSAADFDTFDRYAFIRDHSNAQLGLIIRTAQDWDIDYPFSMALSNELDNLFSPALANMSHFADPHADADNAGKIALGKMLFHDPALSATGKMSCATCHQESKAFTDGLSTFEGQERNSPTLTYAGLQKAFFHDNRSGSLDGQILSVIHSETEFQTDEASLLAKLATTGHYQQQFDSLYSKGMTSATLRNAIANYIRSLNTFDSRFDRNMRGEEESLSPTEIQGFNLFMGKAACATCHFAPLFNGTVPPEYRNTEMELIGVPGTAANQAVDEDPGRYKVMGTPERKFFFKTPGLRNIAVTAPYMHNGVYPTLEQVMEFYNNGGGAGMGFDLPLQTLPFDSLGLSDAEQQAIIAFMHTLTDARYAQQN